MPVWANIGTQSGRGGTKKQKSKLALCECCRFRLWTCGRSFHTSFAMPLLGEGASARLCETQSLLCVLLMRACGGAPDRTAPSRRG
eukprot:6386270-Prymnesium_polylepis.1